MSGSRQARLSHGKITGGDQNGPIAADDPEGRGRLASGLPATCGFGRPSRRPRRCRRAPPIFRRSCSCMAMATMRRCGSRRCGGWNPTALRATACSRSISPIRWRAPTIPSREPNQSSTEDQRRELGEAIKALKRRTGASRVALVGNSRGGNPIRNYIKNGGAADVSHAVLCGVPNHGVYDWDQGLGNEFNGRGPFLRGLNEGDSEVTPGTAFLTLRSDGMDKYAQADGRFVGKPGTPTGITARRPGAEGRDQSRARPGRSSRDRVFAARVCRDLQIHRRPRTGMRSRSRRRRRSN